MVMKRFLSILVAALIGLVMVVPAPLAFAGPRQRISERSTLSGCTLTIQVSWGGLSWVSANNPAGITVNVDIPGDYGHTAYVMATKRSGKATVTFVGTPASTAADAHVFVRAPGPDNAYDESWHSAACIDWAPQE